MKILVHKVPVGADWTLALKREVLQAYAAKMHETFPRERHIFIPDDGSGRGGVTLLDTRRPRKRGQRRVCRGGRVNW